MKEDTSRQWLSVTSGEFPLVLLAITAVLTVPMWWCPLLLLVILLVQSMQINRVRPLPAKDWWRDSEIQKTLSIGLMFWLFAFCRETVYSWFPPLAVFNFDDSTRSACSILNLCGLIAITTYGLTFYSAVKKFAKIPHTKGATRDSELQDWTTSTFNSFSFVFAALIVICCFAPKGLTEQLNLWLLAAFHDANASNMSLAEFGPTNIIAKTVWAVVLTAWLARVGRRIALFCTLLSKQIATQPKTKFANLVNNVLKAPRTVLAIRDKHPFLQNLNASFWYLTACYLGLFWLFGFSGGILGDAVRHTFVSSLTPHPTAFAPVIPQLGSAEQQIAVGVHHHIHATNESLQEFARMRIFIGSIVALYGTVPFAVMSAVFVPYRRRKELQLTPEGILMPDKLSFSTPAIVLWTDFASVDLSSKQSKARRLIIKTHRGKNFSIDEQQLAPRDLEKLLTALDQHSTECKISESVVSMRTELHAAVGNEGKSTELGALTPQNFQSTIFVPHEIGSYLPSGEARVVRLLATRPLSCVYLVRQDNGKLAIAKQFFLAGDSPESEQTRKNFKREYELLQQIEHPHISQVLEVFERDESTYLLIEHAAGQDLREIVQSEGAQPESVVIDWGLQICDIFRYLHNLETPVVHRDLTPDNLILSEDNSIQIIDFGAAHQFLEGITGTIIGKQSFVPPEQLRGVAGPRSDIYSFGCTLHFLLTGVDPVALTQSNPGAQQGVSRELTELVMRCTEFDEEKRPANFEEVKQLLLSIKSGRTPYAVLKRFEDSLKPTYKSAMTSESSEVEQSDSVSKSEVNEQSATDAEGKEKSANITDPKATEQSKKSGTAGAQESKSALRETAEEGTPDDPPQAIYVANADTENPPTAIKVKDKVAEWR